MSQRTIRTLLGLCLTLLMLLPVLQGKVPSLIERFEYDLYDVRLRYFASEEIDPRIVIVDIDERSLAEEGRWPWNRLKLTQMLQQLFDHYGAAIVGFDMVFPEADNSIDLPLLNQLLQQREQLNSKQAFVEMLGSLNADSNFARVIEEYPIVMGYVFDAESRGFPGYPVTAATKQLDQLPIPQARGVLSSLPQLQEAGQWHGFFDNPMVDSDGVYRRVPLLQRYQGQYYPSLALAMTLALFGEESVTPIIESDVTGERLSLAAVDAGGIQIPVDQYGAVLVPYRGPQGSFPYVSATDVINGTADPALLEGTLVLVGTSSAGLLDLRVTPMSHRYAGVEVHANILSGIIDETIQHQPDYTLAVELLQLLVSGILLSLLIPRASVMVSTLVTLFWCALLMVANFYAWQQMLWVIPLGYTLFLVLVLFLFQQTTGYFFETRNIAKLALKFGQYIPPEVVEELSEKRRSVELSGESREMSVFFSDVRGFTTLSETLNPQQLSRLMNIYLSSMTAVIHKHRGTIDKYMGDAVMAFWGAPLDDSQHARNAILAALDMIEVMPEVNRKLEAEGLPAVTAGMGINSGMMNVGNMGSSFRMAYTVLGDAVNLGSRIEGLTKFYGCPLLVSGECAELVSDVLYRTIDRVQVKGRHEPVEILQPIALLNQCSSPDIELIELFNRAVENYRSRQWQQASELFDHYLDWAGEDQPSRVYLARIAEQDVDDLPADWDAVYSHTSK